MINLSQIEAKAATARLAGHYAKSIEIAALYLSSQVAATITWSIPVAYSESDEAVPGVEQSRKVRPSDTCILIGTGSASEIEAQVLSAAWSLGAWNVRRIESAPLADPSQWADNRYGIVIRFGRGGYVIDGQSTISGDRAAEQVVQRAAHDGYVHWQFVPLALSTPIMRKQWGGKDRTLADDCTRGARRIAPQLLAGKQQIGQGHEHIYQLGQANHGNRSKSNAARRA